MSNHLTILLLLPLIASITIAFAPFSKIMARGLTLTVSAVQLILTGILWFSFKASAIDYGKSFEFVERSSWFTLSLGRLGEIHAEYFLGLDGLGLAMVVLTALIMGLATISSWHIEEKWKGYLALLLLLNSAVMGCFMALDFLLFYLFFEFMLLPMYFLIGLWGGPRREYASIKFFLYTLLGSVSILIVMIAINISTIDPAKTAVKLELIDSIDNYNEEVESHVQELLASGKIPSFQRVYSFNFLYLSDAGNIVPDALLSKIKIREAFNMPIRYLAFLLLAIGFAIKIPVVPLHTWLPDAHVEAPTAISVVLAGVLLKVGAYGLIRTGLMMFPEAFYHYATAIGIVGMVSIIYGALNAMASSDMKRLVAYSSVSHMGFVVLGIASINVEGLGGAVFQMVSHGIISAALFILVGVVYDRTKDRMISNYSGLMVKMPMFTLMIVIFFFASMGLPTFSGFIAEVFVLIGSFGSMVIPKWVMIGSTSGLILSAAYFLWTLQRMFFGPFHLKTTDQSLFYDLSTREYIMLVPLALLTLLLGIFPQLLFDSINHTILIIVELVQNANSTIITEVQP